MVYGLQGIQGDQGPRGLQGLPGAAGRDGVDGANGADGATGATGPAGPAGANGIDGVSPDVDVATTDVASGTRVVISVNGEVLADFTVLNGTDGADGQDGADATTATSGTSTPTPAVNSLPVIGSVQLNGMSNFNQDTADIDPRTENISIVTTASDVEDSQNGYPLLFELIVNGSTVNSVRGVDTDGTVSLEYITPGDVDADYVTIIRVTDSEGGVAESSFTVRARIPVPANVAPVVTISGPASLEEGESGTFTANVTDEDVSSVTYQWFHIVDGTGYVQSATGSSASFTFGSSNRNHQVKVVVYDNGNLRDEYTFDVNVVEPSEPSEYVLTPSQLAAARIDFSGGGHTAIRAASGTNPFTGLSDGDSVTVSWGSVSITGTLHQAFGNVIYFVVPSGVNQSWIGSLNGNLTITPN